MSVVLGNILLHWHCPSPEQSVRSVAVEGAAHRAARCLVGVYNRTHALQQTSSLFDHSIGTREQARGYIEAERLPGRIPSHSAVVLPECEKDRVKFKLRQFQETI